jgi:hypothetical protein
MFCRKISLNDIHYNDMNLLVKIQGLGESAGSLKTVVRSQKLGAGVFRSLRYVFKISQSLRSFEMTAEKIRYRNCHPAT